MLDVARRGFGRFGASSILDQCLFSGTNFVTAVLIGRYAGPSELGTYVLCFSVIMLAIALQRAMLISSYVIVRNSLDGTQVRAMRGAILLTTGGFALALAVLAIFAVSIPQITVALAMTMMIALPAALLRDFHRRIAIAELNLPTAIVLDGVVTILQIGALWILVVNKRIDAVNALLVCSGVWVVVGAAGLSVARKQYAVQLHAVRENLMRLWPIGRWVGLSQLVSTAQAFITPWVMAIAHSAELAGIYAACWSIVQVASPAIEGLGNVLSPSFAKNAHDQAWDDLNRNVRAAASLFASMMTALTIAVFFAGGFMLERLYGTDYSQHALILVVLSIAATVNNVGIPANKALVQLGHAKLCFYIGLVGFIVSTGMAFALLVMMGAIGAACGLVFGAAIASIARWVSLIRVEIAMQAEHAVDQVEATKERTTQSPMVTEGSAT